MHLEGVARKTNHEHKDKLSMILRRFHVHKRQHPSFVASLVLKLISSKEEESILDKEQKMLKNFGLGFPGRDVVNQLPWGQGVMPYFQPQGFPSPYGFPSPNALPHSMFVPPTRQKFRPNSPAKQVCFKCQKAGHYVRNCPLNWLKKSCSLSSRTTPSFD